MIFLWLNLLEGLYGNRSSYIDIGNPAGKTPQDNRQKNRKKFLRAITYVSIRMDRKFLLTSPLAREWNFFISLSGDAGESEES